MQLFCQQKTSLTAGIIAAPTRRVHTSGSCLQYAVPTGRESRRCEVSYTGRKRLVVIMQSSLTRSNASFNYFLKGQSRQSHI